MEKELINLKTDDIQKAILETRKKSMKLLEEQGISAIALAISEFLAKFAEHPETALEKLDGTNKNLPGHQCR